MDMRCQKWAFIGYWLGVVAFAVAPNIDGVVAGWIIGQVAAALAG